MLGTLLPPRLVEVQQMERWWLRGGVVKSLAGFLSPVLRLWPWAAEKMKKLALPPFLLATL